MTKRLSVSVRDLAILADACIANYPDTMRVLALLRNGHPRAASYSTSTNLVPMQPANGNDPEAQTPPPAYSDRTGETAYTVDQGAKAARELRLALNSCLRALVDYEKKQQDLLRNAPRNDAPPRSDETWCTNHLRYGYFTPRDVGRDGLCRWCWGVRQDPDYNALPTRDAIDLKESTYPSRLPKDRLDAAMKPAPKGTSRTKKRRRRRG